MEHLIDASKGRANIQHLFATYPTINVMIKQGRLSKRWGYAASRDMGDGAKTQHIAAFNKEDATKQVMFLTETDLALMETAAGKTFTYKTQTGAYLDADTKGVTNVTGAVITFGASATLQTDGVAAGDKFIISADHSSDVEIDVHWGTVLTVDSETQLTLTAAYAGAATTGNALVRMVYSTPTNQRWQYAIVDNKFIFCNTNVDVQVYTGAGYATPLDSTYAKKAKFCLDYANRLILAYLEVSGTMNPWRLSYSGVGAPADWSAESTTAGDIDFAGTADHISGLGKVGPNIIVYKEDSFHLGHRTGDSTDPLTFPSEKPGIGNYAPYSLVHFQNSNAFIWRNDFYIIEGTQPRAIGGRMAYEFFRLVEEANIARTWGFNVQRESQIVWWADTIDGRLGFAWDYRSNEWGIYETWADIVGGGGS